MHRWLSPVDKISLQLGSDKLDTLFCFSSTQETRFIEVLSDTKDVKDIISELTLQPQALNTFMQIYFTVITLCLDFQWLLSWLLHKWREGHLLPT